MNITFIIGNGFDISLGIKSSYSDFYKWYCDKPSIVKYINEFRKEIQNDVARDIPNEEKTWADFEIGLGKYTTKFNKETVEQFLECFEDAQASIIEYLTEQEEKFDIDSFTDESYDLFKKSISNFWEEVADLQKPEIKGSLDAVKKESWLVSFLTFNYTNTLEQILTSIPDETMDAWGSSPYRYTYRFNKNVIHIHGTKEDFPVLGLNDESQIENKELLDTPQFKEFLLKPENVQALGKTWHQKAKQQILNSRFICLLGTSLGPSDAKWWQILVDWLKTNSDRHIILYWFEDKGPNNIFAIQQLRNVEKAKNRLLSYSKLTETEIEALKKRIHVVINTKSFLKLTKKETNIVFADNQDVAELMEQIEMRVAVK